MGHGGLGPSSVATMEKLCRPSTSIAEGGGGIGAICCTPAPPSSLVLVFLRWQLLVRGQKNQRHSGGMDNIGAAVNGARSGVGPERVSDPSVTYG